jgi:hypothetical protein
MAISTDESQVIDQIGQTAGAVWQVLAEKGSLSTARLVKEVGAPRDLVMQALGWLAREDKIHVDDSRARMISLRE